MKAAPRGPKPIQRRIVATAEAVTIRMFRSPHTAEQHVIDNDKQLTPQEDLLGLSANASLSHGVNVISSSHATSP